MSPRVIPVPGALIILGGLSGVGKTTIARELARRLPAVHVRIDSIEQAIRDAGGTVVDVGYRVGRAVAGDNLRLGLSVVADSVNPLPVTRDAWVAVATQAGARALEVEIICSDANEHRRRVETRAADIPDHHVPTWNEVIARDYRPWERERLVIDSARRTEDACATLIERALTLAG